MATIFGERTARERDAPGGTPTAPFPATPARATAAGRRRRSAFAVLAALVAGGLAATLLLAGSLHTEFPLFSEASAERGRDCTAVASARHALEATLRARLPLRAADADAAREVRSAVAAFEARTRTVVTPAVAASLSPVRGGLAVLADRVQTASAAPGTATTSGVEDAWASVQRAWKGPIGRVCG